MLVCDGLGDSFCVDAHNLLQFAHFAVLYEVVGESQAGHLWMIAIIAHPFQYGGTQPAFPGSVLNGDDALELASHLIENLLVEGLEEAHVVVGN